MQFWEENKKLVIGVATAAVALLVMFPTLYGIDPVIWSFQSWDYNRAKKQSDGLKKTLEKLYPRRGMDTKRVLAAVEEHNRRLHEEHDALKKAMTMVVPKPFRIGGWVGHKGAEALRILSHALTNRQRYCAVRGVSLSARALHFGFDKEIQSGVLPANNDDKIREWLLQLAAVDDIVKAAVDARVMEIDLIERLAPFKRGAIITKPLPEGADPKTTEPVYHFYPHFMRVYPIHVRVFCSLDSLMAFIHSLEGLHGQVIEYTEGGAKGERQSFVRINLGKQHGLELTGSDRGAIARFIVFGSERHGPDTYTYKGHTLRLVDVNDTESTWQPYEALGDLDPQEEPKGQIKKGDNVSSRFYTVLDIKLAAREPEQARGKEPGKPARLEVDLWVGAVDFFEPKRAGPPQRPTKTGTGTSKPPTGGSKHLGF